MTEERDPHEAALNASCAPKRRIRRLTDRILPGLYKGGLKIWLSLAYKHDQSAPWGQALE
jgi:hypothetical protein